MFKPASSMVCPNCKSEMQIEKDGKGLLSTKNLLTMRIKSPIYIHSQKTAEVSIDVSVCSQCNTIIGITRKGI